MTTTTAAAATQTATSDTATARPGKGARLPKALPAPNSDLYQLADVLTAETTKVQPINNRYWSDDAFPF
jgi:hypothetical protein